MRRALVLTDETARHPFRASLPPHVCRPVKGHPVTGRPVTGRPVKTRWRPSVQDVKEFLLAYCACFIAVSVFIS